MKNFLTALICILAITWLTSLAASAPNSLSSPLVPLYRLVNETSDACLLTINLVERDRLVSHGWRTVGTVGYVYPRDSAAGLKPLYCLHNPATTGVGAGDRVYTAAVTERDAFLNKGYHSEGTACYVFPPNTPGFYKPLYRAVNAATGQHSYTGGQIEYEGLFDGWRGEGSIASLYPSSLTALPTRSASQATQIAERFCQDIGSPVTAAGIAKYPVPYEDDAESEFDTDTPQLSLSPRWQIKFGEQATVEVVDATGVVSDYSNDGYSLRQMPYQPAGPFISKKDAIQRANAVIAATSQDDATGTIRAELHVNNSPHPNVGDASWQVIRNRQLNGISYHDDAASAIMDAETGEMEVFGLSYYTLPPRDTTIVISRTKAQVIARNQLAASGIQEASMNSLKTEIVTPNSFWQNGGESFGHGTGRVAWIYAFAEPGERMGEVWVDAQNGAVIGGSEYGMRGGAEQKLSAVKSKLKKTPKPHQAVRTSPKPSVKKYGKKTRSIKGLHR